MNFLCDKREIQILCMEGRNYEKLEKGEPTSRAGKKKKILVVTQRPLAVAASRVRHAHEFGRCACKGRTTTLRKDSFHSTHSTSNLTCTRHDSADGMSVDQADDVAPDQHGLVRACDQSGLRVRDSPVDAGGR